MAGGALRVLRRGCGERLYVSITVSDPVVAATATSLDDGGTYLVAGGASLSAEHV